ncbi:MAG: prepilin peptidase [archaeon]
MWNYIYPALALAVLLMLSYTDIKERIAPPQITYGLLITGLGLHAIQSAMQKTLQPLLYSLFGLTTMFALAYFIYLMGGWAGGDVKLFSALGATIPFYGIISSITYPIPYPILILAASTISVLPFTIIYAFYNLFKEKTDELKEDIVKSLPKSIYSGFVLTAALYITTLINAPSLTVILIAPFIYLIKEPGYPITAFFFTLSILSETIPTMKSLSFFLAISVIFVTGIKTYKSIKKNVLREERKVKELKEGEIPAEDVWKKEEDEKLEKREPSFLRSEEIGEIVIDSRKARGLTEEEIKILEESNIKKIKTKKSLPFIPILTLGFIILLILEIIIKP